MMFSAVDTVPALAAGIAGLFDVRIDGQIATERKLRGKPAPDTYLAAAAELKVPADRAAVFEDALAATSHSWSAWTGWARRSSCISTARTSW